MDVVHVLINCDSGFEIPIIDQLKVIDGVREARGILGAYDIIVKLEGPTRESLRKIIPWNIRKDQPREKHTNTSWHRVANVMFLFKK